jgi:uncharacterized protein YndB with AHSA1/START domain
MLDGSDCEGSQGEFAETVVTIEFQTTRSGTRLVLTHDFLPSANSRTAHQMGWDGCLDSLTAMLS